MNHLLNPGGQLGDRSWQLARNLFMDWQDAAFLALARRDRQCVVLANGCFDLLHAGHLWLLEWAKNLSYEFTCGYPTFVIAAANCDDGVSRLKGPGRPVVPLAQRLYALASLKWVDCAVGFKENTPVSLLEAVRPHVLVKGSEYAEAAVVGKEYAATVVLAPMLPGVSTTLTVERMRPRSTC